MPKLLTLAVLCVSLLSSSTAWAARYVIVDPPVSKEVNATAAQAIADVAAGALSRAGHDVVTRQQMEAMIGLEAAKQLAGCSAGTCIAELGAALGADGLITIAVAKVGRTMVVAVKRLDVGGPTARVADRRLKTSHLDVVMDAVPELVAEVTAGIAAAPTLAVGGVAVKGDAALSSAARSSAVQGGFAARLPVDARPPKVVNDVAATIGAKERGALRWLKGDNGQFLAYAPEAPYSGPLFVGDKKRVWAQRLNGGSRNGDTQFDAVFWDPRFGGGSEREFVMKDGAFKVRCGNIDHAFSPTMAPAGIKLLAPRWQRQLVLVARDDDLTWYFVDKARDDDNGKKPDFHLYVGPRDAIKPIKAEVVEDPSFGRGVMAVTGDVRIKIGPAGAERIVAGVKTPLTVLDLYATAADVYGSLRPWGAHPLGTPCDVDFP